MISNRGFYSSFTDFPKQSLKKTALITMLFVFLSPMFIDPEPLSLIVILLCCFWVAASSFKVNKNIILLLIPLIAMLVIGCYGIFKYALYDVIRDVWYVGKMIPVLALGYILARYIKDIRLVFFVIIIAALFFSVIHLYNYIISGSNLNDSVQQIRNAAGRGNILVVLGMVVILAGRHYSIRMFPENRILLFVIMLILFTSLVLSFSRTLWLSLLIFLFYIYLDTKKLKLWGTGILMSLALIIILLGNEIKENTMGNELSFSNKVINSISEISLTDYSDIQSINNNWRGYESYMALQTYLSGSVFELVVGHGFGKQIDLGLYMKLGDEEYRFIPITHNGFIYVLVKTGGVGLLLYFMFFVKVLSSSKEYIIINNENIHIVASLLSGVTFSILILTLIVTGLFNSNFISTVILMGFFLGYLKCNYA